MDSWTRTPCTHLISFVPSTRAVKSYYSVGLLWGDDGDEFVGLDKNR